MKKLCVFCMALLMLAMTACGKDTSGGGQSVDLRAAYEAAIAQVNEELGDNAPALLEETAVEMLNGYYPGIADIQLKQSVFFLSPTATSCELRGAGGAAGGLHRARRISGQILTLRCIFPPYVV